MDINALKSRLDIRRVFEDEGFIVKDIRGKLSTKCFRGHSSKSGTSFNLYENKFKCWNCGASGNSIDFIMEYKNMEFKEAIHYLRDKYAPDMVDDRPSRQKVSIDYSAINDVFMASLRAEKNKAVSMLLRADFKKRQLHYSDVIEKYKIGYVKKGVLSWMLQKGIANTSKLEALGFISNDVLHGEERFSVPIIRNDKIIGFSLRSIHDTQTPKYLNFIDKTIKYNNIMFNIDKIQNEVIVTEGVFDAIKLTEEGFPAVAMFGTKFNADLLKRYNRVTLFYDGDTAGIKAGIEAFFLGFKKIKMLYSANNAYASDPCEMDSASLQYCMITARPTFEYVIEKSFKYGIKPEEKVKTAMNLIDRLQKEFDKLSTPLIEQVQLELARQEFPEIYKLMREKLQ